MGAPVTSSGGRGRGYRRQQFTEINVTPFVDVVLVLLIIFMVTAPMLTAGVEVDLPNAKAGSIQGKDEPLSITIQSGGKIFIQETLVSDGTLIAKLQAIAGENFEKRIFIRADRNIDYGDVMQVVGNITSAGFTKIALVTEPEKSRR